MNALPTTQLIDVVTYPTTRCGGGYTICTCFAIRRAPAMDTSNRPRGQFEFMAIASNNQRELELLVAEEAAAIRAQHDYDEYEANTTAELDAYLDKQLALQAELTKMRVDGTPTDFNMTEEEFKS